MTQPQGHFGYQIVWIIKTSSLGIGSYGAVYRALCNDLPCAAKILHPTLFETYDPGSRKIMERFEQECQLLSGVRHPHIVQYLGVNRDPESGLPVLLMELMDSSLTKFLEQSEEPLPFYIQVNLCHDVALALAYLHSNGILHRDLSSNNVLLIGPGYRAKVTDFGMSKLADATPHMTPMTMCPGTQAYMPPEALDDSPVYTNKLDSFSFGVLDIQILTRQFPDPSQRFKTMEINDPRFPTGRIKVPVPEVDRRQSHIDLIGPNHPLLPVALDCLKDMDRERPSAQELCHCLAALKETHQYNESVHQSTSEGKERQISELQREKAQLIEQHTQQRDQHAHQIRDLQQQVQTQSDHLQARESELTQQIGSLQLQLQGKDREMEERLQELNTQIQSHKFITAELIEQHTQQREKHAQHIGHLKQQVQTQSDHLQARESELTQQIGSLQLQLQGKDREMEERVQELNAQIQSHKLIIVEFQQNLLRQEEMIQELQQELRARQDNQIHPIQRDETRATAEGSALVSGQLQKSQTATHQLTEPHPSKVDVVGNFQLHWRDGGRADFKGAIGSVAVVGNIAYFNPESNLACFFFDIFRYETGMWSTLPVCRRWGFTIAVIDGLPTVISGSKGGGEGETVYCDSLLSLIGEGQDRKWVEHFPPMPTKRKNPAVVCSGKSLVVAGGTGDNHRTLNTIEVMNTETLQWSTASRLPDTDGKTSSCSTGSATICGEQIYIQCGIRGRWTQNIVACSLTDLLKSCQSTPQSQLSQSQSLGAQIDTPLREVLKQHKENEHVNVWRKVAELPHERSTITSMCGQLLAVGGVDPTEQDPQARKPTDTIHRYNPATDSWEVISHMPTARCDCLVAVLPSNELMVVGGRIHGVYGDRTDIVEIGTLV